MLLMSGWLKQALFPTESQVSWRHVLQSQKLRLPAQHIWITKLFFSSSCPVAVEISLELSFRYCSSVDVQTLNSTRAAGRGAVSMKVAMRMYKALANSLYALCCFWSLAKCSCGRCPCLTIASEFSTVTYHFLRVQRRSSIDFGCLPLPFFSL